MSIFFIWRLLLMTDTLQSIVHGKAQPIDNHVDVVCCRDIGRREQHMVAALAIRSAAGRVAAEPAGKRSGLDLLVKLERGIERGATGAIGHQLDRPEKSTAPDVADVTVITEALRQAAFELGAARLH